MMKTFDHITILHRSVCCPNVRRLTLTMVVLLSLESLANAQFPTPTFGQQGITSPEIGSLQGIQRFGESLRTDPDQGVGFTYRVLPTTDERGGLTAESFLWAIAHIDEAHDLKDMYQKLSELIIKRDTMVANGQSTAQIRLQEASIRKEQVAIAELELWLKLRLGDGDKDTFGPYATGRDTTAGFRNSLPESSNRLPLTSYAANSLSSTRGERTVTPPGIGVSGTLFSGEPANEPLYHQPLIQVKVRIVEATRQNTSDFHSVLDYISRTGTGLTSLAGANQGGNINNINNNLQSTRGRTTFAGDSRTLAVASAATMLENLNDGRGALVNLTTEHLNIITSMLVTDFRGDVFTVPEVVTLNGQNVEFVAGDKRPFPLGLSLTQGNGESNQEFFYKHVGTLLSITPRIVNWGKHLEGHGDAPIVAQEIGNWNRLAKWMIDPANLHQPELQKQLRTYAHSKMPVPWTVKEAMLNELDEYDPDSLRVRLSEIDQISPTPDIYQMSYQEGQDLQPGFISIPVESETFDTVLVPPSEEATVYELPILLSPSGRSCDWKPEDCTIDLEILVRESDVRNSATSTEVENSISNVVQVRSGHGVVLGGMIASSEVQRISKVPVLGDLPGVGYAFRSKSTDRVKSELIILVEATVLPDSGAAREMTAHDFRLGADYVSGELHDNPLETGMHRAGFAPYLPPACADEDDYWCRHASQMRRVATELDDIFK